MKKFITPVFAGLLLMTACKKDALEVKQTTMPEGMQSETASRQSKTKDGADASRLTGVYSLYTIGTGMHTCDQTKPQFVSLSSMNFKVKFDNSAIYQTVNPANQNDINMLYGFSEGFDHKYNSARIGWSYNGGSLKLYGYVYNRGVVSSKYITTVAIGAESTCSIKLNYNCYSITVNGVNIQLPRTPLTPSTWGYQLYPYFGGTEAAPHAVYINIMDL